MWRLDSGSVHESGGQEFGKQEGTKGIGTQVDLMVLRRLDRRLIAQCLNTGVGEVDVEYVTCSLER